MTAHYYSSKPTAAHERNELRVNLRGNPFTFVTDAGVFSKTNIDYGSRLLIEAMDIGSHHRVLDVGCGYGPVGICAAVLAKQGHVTMVDINERAVQLSRENAARNGVNNVTVLQSDILEQVNDRHFNRILTNPPIRAGKDVVYRIFEQAYEALAIEGQLWVVIQKKQGAPSAFAKLEAIFGEVEEVIRDKGYRVFKATKRS